MAKGNKAWVPLMRQRIEASQVADRLINHVTTNPGLETYETDLMQPTQVTAALGLLKKVMPDLKALEVTGADGVPLFDRIEREIVDPQIARVVPDAKAAD